MSLLNLSARQWEIVHEVNGILMRKKPAYLLEHLAVFVVTPMIWFEPSLGQCVGQLHRFFHFSLIETQNQEGLQRRPRVRVVPLFASFVQGSWSATYDETRVSFSYVNVSNAVGCCSNLIQSNLGERNRSGAKSPFVKVRLKPFTFSDPMIVFNFRFSFVFTQTYFFRSVSDNFR